MFPLHIVVADDHEIVRRGLKTLLEAQPGWQVDAEAANGREAVEKAEQLKPDVVLLDISMPELNGLEATRRIRKLVPKAEVLLLTMHDSEQMLRQAVEAGARGYLLKSDAGRELIAAVESLHRHKPFFSSRVARGPAEPAKRTSDGPPLVNLTPREREILQLLAEGKTSKDVATNLHITVKTAETHRTNMMRKLDLHSVSELVRYAIRNKIVEP